MSSELKLLLAVVCFAALLVFLKSAQVFDELTAKAALDWLRCLDPRIWQAVIAGAFLSIGWIVNGVQERRRKDAQKREKLREFHKALVAEIRGTLARLAEDGPSEGEALSLRISKRFRPLVPRERHDRVFERVLADIDVLPRQTIDEVIDYYGQIEALQQLADDLRSSEAREQLSSPRFRALYQDYLAMRRVCFAKGEVALALIIAFAEGSERGDLQAGARAAELRAQQLGKRQ